MRERYRTVYSVGEALSAREPMTDRAVYLGDGVWWQLSQRLARSLGKHNLPEKYRPWKL